MGHEVLRENHIGDWGTPFGMLIEHLIDVGGAASVESFSVRDLNEFYAQARSTSTVIPNSASAAASGWCFSKGETPRRCASGRSSWPRACGTSTRSTGCWGCSSPTTTSPARCSNSLLDLVVDEFGAEGLLVEDDGALCVFPEGFTNRQGDPLPLIVRKSDGGTATPPRTWRASATARNGAARPRCSSTSWGPSSRSICSWC